MNARTSLFLMANLGAEVSRIISAKEKGEKVMVDRALERASIMLDEINALPDMKPRANELELLRMAITDVSREHPTLNIKPHELKRYFLPFATRLMS